MYDNATKDTWRRWAWNQLRKRLVPGARVLCLAGDLGAEAKLGKEKGFEVVGCDLRVDPVREFRKAGGVAIQEDFSNVVAGLQPEGAVFDAMGGLTRRSFWNVRGDLFTRKAFVWNGLRGRERDNLLHISSLETNRVPVMKDGRMHWSSVGLHRGKHAFVVTALDLFFASYCKELFGTFTLELTKNVNLWREAMGAINVYGGIECVLWDSAKILKPEYFTYASRDSGKASLRYDSVAMFGFFRCDPSEFVKTTSPKMAAAKALLTKRKYSN